MVGNFLHPNRKNRTTTTTTTPERSAGTTNGRSSHLPATTPTASIGAVASAMNYNPHSTMLSSSRYASSSSSFDNPALPFMPPQNLTAEAVAALPPPGKVLPLPLREVWMCVHVKSILRPLTNARSLLETKACRVHLPSNLAPRMHPMVDPST